MPEYKFHYKPETIANDFLTSPFERVVGQSWEYKVSPIKEQGLKKFDQGKPKFTSIPQKALLEVAKVFTHGAEKYGMFNYSLGTDNTRLIDALLRHTNQYLTGEDIDESGVHHLACVAANALMALDAHLTGKERDTRNSVYKS